MSKDFYAALCLVLVLEGLMLFAAPKAWQRMARQASAMEPRSLRMIGAAALAIGVIALRLVY